MNRNGARIAFGRNAAGKVTFLSDGTSVHSYDRAGLFDSAGLFNAAIGAAFLLSITTLAGAWRRQGRPVEHKPIGVWLNRGDVAVSGLVLLFIGLLTATFAVLATASASVMLNYPPFTIILLRLAGLVLFGAAILYDTSNVLHHYPEDRYVGAAVQLFASVALLFWYVLQVLMSFAGDD